LGSSKSTGLSVREPASTSATYVGADSAEHTKTAIEDLATQRSDQALEGGWF
jgi:hypothetical protein